MGVRGEIFSTRLILPSRTYFLNVKENRLGDLYLNIVESKNQDAGGFERQSVIVFADDLPAFLGEFDKALNRLEKIAKEQKQGGKSRPVNRKSGEEKDRPRRDSRPQERTLGRGRSQERSQEYSKERSKERHQGRSERPYDRERPQGRSKERYQERPQDRYQGRSQGRSQERSQERPQKKRVIIKKTPGKKADF